MTANFSYPLAKQGAKPFTQSNEGVVQKKQIRKQFFFELDSMMIENSEGILEFINKLKEEFDKKPAVTINKFLSGIPDERDRISTRNRIYSSKY